jgi:hypothetical protein
MKNKAKFIKYLIAIVGTAFLVWLIAVAALFLIPTNSRDNQDPSKQKEMMALVLEWGRLAPFPANATNVMVETEGSSFTRSFRASFVAPKQDIQSWIKESPGINEATPEELSDNQICYSIVPGGGANKAEVTIDFILNKVEIYVSWS